MRAKPATMETNSDNKMGFWVFRSFLCTNKFQDSSCLKVRILWGIGEYTPASKRSKHLAESCRRHFKKSQRILRILRSEFDHPVFGFKSWLRCSTFCQNFWGFFAIKRGVMNRSGELYPADSNDTSI